ncbi:Receptor-type tyrosine-protein phosphatase F [Lamellibrachia satsuma]|nr:Receptor-type tyrosine-protein phosphatase F [Lamellibrachia satsuma]
MEGETIQLQCVVYGSPQPNITWYQDGTELNLKSDRLRQTSTGLELSYLTGADSGRYRCQASNVAGSSSSEGTLLVHVRPTLIFFPPDRRVNQSQSVIMFCDAEGVPKPNITWLYNGSSLLPEGASVESQRIAISSVQPVHTGWYTCVATNHLGKSNHTAFLLVQVKPYVSSITGSTVIDRGDSLEVLCHVTGVPQPTVRWLFQHFVLVPTLDHRLTFGKDNSMTIRYVTPVDAGQYSCVANNEVGSDSKDFLVTVRDLPLAPHISSVRPLSMSSVLVTWQPGRDVSNKNLTYFVIQFKQRNALTFDSFKDDIPVTLTSYEVDTLLPAIDYLFRVAMRNDLGRSPYSNVIEARTFENAPSSPRNFRLLFHNDTAVELQWEVPRVRNGDIRTYQVQYRIKFQQEFRHRVNIEIPTMPLQRYVCATLRPFTAYQWRVRAATIQDSMTLWSSYTEVLDVTTSAAAPSDSPTNVHLIIQSSSKILVSWEPMSPDSENGALEGYCVLYRELHSGMPKMEKCVPPGILDAKITGLLPWRYYEVTVIAYNNIGRGVESRPLAARTFPQAPGGQPRDIKLQALPMLSIQVRWKQLLPETENCDVSGYVVRYNLFTESTTHSVYVANEGTLTKVIR